jgi:ABC-type multidrug transport system ATPase subunit
VSGPPGATVELDAVSVEFDDRGIAALQDVTLSIAAGDHIAVLGASGSGKTTLLRAILGAVPYRGEIRVDHNDPAVPAQRSLIRRQTGVLRQGADLVPPLSARINMVMGCSHRFSATDWATVVAGRVPRALRDRLAHLSERHDITECLDAPVCTLSGGQRQRVALVRAVLGHPRLLIADEPTSGLDPVSAGRVVSELREAAEGTVIVTTHDLAVARGFPRILGMRSGQLMHDAATFGTDQAEALYRDTRE